MVRESIFCLSLVILCACNSPRGEGENFSLLQDCLVSSEINWQKDYWNEELGFRIGVPEDYVLNVDDPNLVLVATNAYNDSNTIESFSVSAAIITQPKSIDELFRESIESDRIAYDESNDIDFYKVSDTGELNLGVTRAKWLLHSYKVTDMLEFTLLDVYLLKDGVAFKITFGSYAKDFSKYGCKFLEIAKTIRIN